MYYDDHVERSVRVFFRMGTRSHMLIGTEHIVQSGTKMC
jgi:hypothetical protein